MERHIDRIRIFKAQASPAYMSLTYVNDPVSHAFDCVKKAKLGMRREPEFRLAFPVLNLLTSGSNLFINRQDFEETQAKCKSFAVAILDSCRNSAEVEMVLDDPVNALNKKKVSGLAKLEKPAKIFLATLGLWEVSLSTNPISQIF